MDRNSGKSPPIPYPVDSRYSLQATGLRRKGGVLDIYCDGIFVKRIKLPAALWGILMFLMLARIESASTKWTRAFRTSADLARLLHSHLGLGNSDPANVLHYVRRLRQAIAKAMKGLVANPDEWGKQLVEHQDSFGYRIGLAPPRDSDLDICDEDPD